MIVESYDPASNLRLDKNAITVAFIPNTLPPLLNTPPLFKAFLAPEHYKHPPLNKAKIALKVVLKLVTMENLQAKQNL